MPELPEVETIRRDLSESIRGIKITTVDVRLPRLVRGRVDVFLQKLHGAQFQNIHRIGKLLSLQCSDDLFVLVHLKMTGQLIYQKKETTLAGGHSYSSDTHGYPNAYTYIIFGFADGSFLYFNDMRTFGYMQLVDSKTRDMVYAGYGIEPLTKAFTFDAFCRAIAGRKTTIKAVLLNQKIIAGIGNIYADEICFAAGVLPMRGVATLSHDELVRLHRQTEKIIKKAIGMRGTTFNTFVDSRGKKGSFLQELKVFGRQGTRCLICKKAIIQKTKVAGRGTHFCPVCQQ